MAGREPVVGRETGTGGVGAGQAALAVIVVAGTALGALALRPGGPARGKGPWGQHGLAVAALVVELAGRRDLAQQALPGTHG